MYGIPFQRDDEHSRARVLTHRQTHQKDTTKHIHNTHTGKTASQEEGVGVWVSVS